MCILTVVAVRESVELLPQGSRALLAHLELDLVCDARTFHDEVYW